MTIGLHWAALQSAAWATMLVKRSQSGSLAMAVKTTFDGQHPCPLCEIVRAGKNAEKKSETVVRVTKLEWVLQSFEVALPAVPDADLLSRPVTNLPGCHTDAPPLPPPRV